MSEKLLLIDGNSIINRAFYGVPLLTNTKGQYTNAIYGFLNILWKLLEEEQPQYIAVAFDVSAPTFRHKTFESYKGTRNKMPDELRQQLDLLKKVLQSMNISIYEQEGFEADDILGSLSYQAQQKGIAPVILSGDRDLLQLASDTLKIRIYKTKSGKTEIATYYENDVVVEYGVTPQEFIEVKALMGDSSDNVPGVPSIGEKTATKLIQQYHDVETVLAHAQEVKPKKASENLITYCEQARLSKFLVTIVRDMELEINWDMLKLQNVYTPEAYQYMCELEFHTMLKRFEGQSCTKNKQLQITHITTSEQAKSYFDSLQPVETAYHIIVDDGCWYGMLVCQKEYEVAVLEITEQLLPIELIDIAMPFLTSDIYKKIGHDTKEEMRILTHTKQVHIDICFDTALASYVLNPTQEQYTYEYLAKEYLSELYPSMEELLGKGKKKIPLISVPEQERVSFLARQIDVLYRVKPILEQQLQQTEQFVLFSEIEMKLLYVLYDMERYGIKVDKSALLCYQHELELKISQVVTEIYELSGEEFNINSPKQLAVILFEKLKLQGSKKTKTGYSTAVDVLEKLQKEHPIVEKILYYRQLAKLKSTYADGLLSVMDTDTHKIHSTFHQTITATGRISSAEPNLQNIPIRLSIGRELRKVFIPSSEEYCFLDADYSQIELRILAHMANEQTLIDAFANNQDIHRLTASQVFHVPFEEVTELQRRNAKAVNFGIVYGIGAFSLSQDLEISRKEAEQYIEAYFEKYPKIKQFQESMIAQATEKGYAETLYHRRRAMPELKSTQFVQRGFGERVAMNMPIQGTAADIIKIAMIRVHNALQEGNYRSRLILQVHDELLIETHKDEIEAVSKILKENMEQAAQLSVQLLVDVHKGENWLEAK